MALRLIKNTTALAAIVTVLVVGPAQGQTILRVGAAESSPFNSYDSQAGTHGGVMFELVTAICEELGCTVEVRTDTLANMATLLSNNEIDVIATTFSITPARQEQAAFTEPFLSYGEGLAVPAVDTHDYASLEDLRGKVLAVVEGSAIHQGLSGSDIFSEIKTYATVADARNAVIAGEADANLANGPAMAYQMVVQGRFPELRYVSTYKPSLLSARLGLAVRKEDGQLLGRLNEALTKMRADGRLKDMFVKWGFDPSSLL